MNTCLPTTTARTNVSTASPAVEVADPAGPAPSLILLGAQKAGSSFLFDALAAGLCCFGSTPKEPSFFSRWDRVRSDAAWTDYTRLFEASGDTQPAVTLEATTGYLADAQAPLRMRERLPGTTRFVAILRDPAERSISAYWHLYKRGDDRRDIHDALGEVGSDLRDAIETEQARCQQAVHHGKIDLERYRDRYDDPVWPARYITNSAYLSALQGYVNVFGRERLHVVLIEDLLDQPERVWRELCAFLDLDPTTDPPDVGRPANATRVPRRTATGRLLRAVHRGSFERATRWRAGAIHAALTRLKYAPKPDMPPGVIRNLRNLFQPHNRELADWLDVELPSAWLGACDD